MGFLGILGLARGFLGPILALFMSFVNTPIGAGITAAVGAHYVTKWSEQRKAKIACDARAAESQRQAFDADTQAQVEALTRAFKAEQEIQQLREQQVTKDKDYEKALAEAEREEAAAKAKAARAGKCSTPRGRAATPADDSRVFPHK